MLALIVATLLSVLAAQDTDAVAKPKPRTVLDQLTYAPAPPRASLVYDPVLENAGAPSAGAYANTDTMTVHALKGQEMDPVSAGHEVGHLFDVQILSDGDRRFFSRLLGTDPASWQNLAGGNPGGAITGTEAFSDYYTVAANGIDMRRGGYTGYVTVDPKISRKFNAALGRLGKRHGLKPLSVLDFLASGT